MKIIFYLFIYKKLGINKKVGLEHRNYSFDLKTLKITTMGMIPSLIPSRALIYYNPPGSNQVSRSILIKYALFATLRPCNRAWIIVKQSSFCV